MKTENNRVPMRPGIYEFDVEDEKKILCGRRMEGQDQENQEQNRTSIKVEIRGLLSDRGITCMTYEGVLPANGRKVIVKEFYPHSTRNIWGIFRNETDQRLHIPSMIWRTDVSEPSEITSRFRQFVRSYDWQKRFYSDPRFLEIVVEPEYLASYGDTYYIISDFHNGRSMKEKLDCFGGLSEKLFLFRYLADLMTILEENGLLFLDVSLDNFLVIDQTTHHYQLRLFDLDSILNLNEIDELHRADGNVFYHEEYASREIRDLERLLRRNSFDDIKKDYIERSAAVYSLGVLFFRILFGRVPDQSERLIEDSRALLSGRLAAEYDVALDMADELLTLLKNMMAEQWERYQTGFDSCRKVLEFLNDFSEKMNYETYVSRSEMANANATFAAYNMLQKFPLFHYAGTVPSADGKRILRAAIVGSHMMRGGFLSAFLSIGQMLNTDLEIAVLAPDAGAFWEEYTRQNTGLQSAVLAEIGQEPAQNLHDRNLVSSPLARIRILDGAPEKELSGLYREGYRYFALLDAEPEVLKMVKALNDSGAPGDPRICVGCLQRGSRQSGLRRYDKNMDLHWISGRNVSEMYSEKMYREQVYRMGLMAHAYYSGCLNSGSGQDMPDMKKTEEEYKEDIYSRMSSARAALHGIYKMGSVGIDVSRPGRFRAYFEKLQDEQTVEELGWLEHRSWTAYMLSVGHVPAAVSEMDSYAYQWGNDWKDKRDPHRIRHPLLAASEPERRLPPDGWQDLTAEEINRLDPLDQVSCGIYQWYCGRRPALLAEIDSLFADMPETAGPKVCSLLNELYRSSRECAEHMGERPNCQDPVYSQRWQQAQSAAESFLNGRKKDRETALIRERLEKLKPLMKIVQDSYRNRDFKQLDRDIVYFVLDMIVV